MLNRKMASQMEGLRTLIKSLGSEISNVNSQIHSASENVNSKIDHANNINAQISIVNAHVIIRLARICELMNNKIENVYKMMEAMSQKVDDVQSNMDRAMSDIEYFKSEIERKMSELQERWENFHRQQESQQAMDEEIGTGAGAEIEEETIGNGVAHQLDRIGMPTQEMGKVVSVKPAPYDDHTHRREHQHQFEFVATSDGWSKEQELYTHGFEDTLQEMHTSDSSQMSSSSSVQIVDGPLGSNTMLEPHCSTSLDQASFPLLDIGNGVAHQLDRIGMPMQEMGKVVSVKPAPSDDHTHWKEHQNKFEFVATSDGWSKEQKLYTHDFEDTLQEMHTSDSSQMSSSSSVQIIDVPLGSNTMLEPHCSTSLDQASFPLLDAFSSMEGVVVKDEPQTVPSPNSIPPLSPINTRCKEMSKLERLRQKNRLAAIKHRRRKLERISQLEEKVKLLKGENSELECVLHKLKDQVCQLKVEVMEHVRHGCKFPNFSIPRQHTAVGDDEVPL